MSFVRENVREGARSRRMHNIAEIFVELYKKQVEVSAADEKCYGLDDLRSMIRSRLRTTLGEDWDYMDGDVSGGRLGDLRAHGDAAGRHGLHLLMRACGGRKFVPLNKFNYEICENELRSEHEMEELLKG